MARRVLLAAALVAASCGRPPDPVDPGFPLRNIAARAPGPRVALVAGVHGGLVDGSSTRQRIHGDRDGIVLHQRLAGRVSRETPLVILGVPPDAPRSPQGR